MIKFFLTMLLIAVFFTACTRYFSDAPKPTAQAVIQPLFDSEIKGVIVFQSRRGQEILYQTQIEGLTGDHGLHIHTGTNCNDNLGGHWNPNNAQHGHPQSPDHHLGDMYNIRSGRTINIMENVALSTGPNGIIGRIIVITERPDDYISSYDGQSGRPIACGVIKSVSPR